MSIWSCAAFSSLITDCSLGVTFSKVVAISEPNLIIMKAAAPKTATSKATFAEGLFRNSGQLALRYLMAGFSDLGSAASAFFDGPRFLDASGFLVRLVSCLSSFVFD